MSADGNAPVEEELLDWESDPLDTYADVDTSKRGFTELRVHGVSGPPPENVLQIPAALVTMIDGNADSGFWRRWRVGGRAQDVDVPDKRQLEAFCWGGLTSRASLQALWLLLLPFSMVNLAHWMIPPYIPGRRWLAQTAVVLLRVLALSFTLTFLLSVAEITMDLGAWQCGANSGCAKTLLPFSLAANRSDGFRLVTAAVALSLLLVLLLVAGSARFRPLQQGTDAPKPAVPRSTHDGAAPVLSQKEFWNVDKSTRWLRALHAVAWCAGVGAICTGVVRETAAASTTGHLVAGWMTALNLCVIGGVFLLVLLPERFGRGGRGSQNTTGIRWLISAAVLLLIVSLAVTVAYLPDRTPPGVRPLPFIQGAFGRLTLLQAAGLLALFACVVGLSLGDRRVGTAKQPRAFRPFLGGMLAFVVAYVGWFLMLVFTAGFGLWEANNLGTPVDVSQVQTPGQPLPLVMPPSFAWINIAALVAIVGIVLAAVVILVQLVRPTTIAMQMLANGRDVWNRRLQQIPEASRKKSWRAPPEWDDLNKEEVGHAQSAARFQILAQHVEWVPGILFLTCVSSFVVFAIAVITYFRQSADSAWFPVDGPVWSLATVGASAVTYGAGALIVLAYTAYRNANTRRLVGIIWDVTTFWPRANHPLTPACSAQRSVPQLYARVGRLTRHPSDRVVLSLHSQGSILGAAAVLQMGRNGPLRNVGVLSYGNPLRRLYTRAFPAYFPLEVLQRLHHDVNGTWLNLWAKTDPIGGPIFPADGCPLCGVQDPPGVGASGRNAASTPPRDPLGQPPLEDMDWRMTDMDWRMLPDPLTVEVDRRTGEGVLVCDHSGYLARPEYQVALWLLRRRKLDQQTADPR
jgi:hypothetical protein